VVLITATLELVEQMRLMALGRQAAAARLPRL